MNIHTLWSLVQARPETLRDPALGHEPEGKIGKLMDENLVSTRTRRELDALQYGVAIATRR